MTKHENNYFLYFLGRKKHRPDKDEKKENPIKNFLKWILKENWKSIVFSSFFFVFSIFPSVYYLRLPTLEKYYMQQFSPSFSFFPQKKHEKRKKLKKFSPLRVITYETVVGDTFWNVAKKVGIKLDTILSFNHIKKTHHLLPKTVLLIPTKNGILHKQQKEQKIQLEDLADQYNIAIEKIRYYNQEKNKEYFFIPDAAFSLHERINLYGKEFLSPLRGLTRITSFFGFRIHPITKKRSRHHGIDLSCSSGDPVYATKGGIVESAYTANGYGKSVILNHGRNTLTRYAHLSDIKVKKGEKIYAGKVIGTCGNSGNVTGPHLHFEVIRLRKPINPLYITDLPKK